MRGRGLEFSISKNFVYYSLSLKFFLFFKNNPLYFKMLIDFCRFLYNSVEKVLFKADVFFCMTEIQRQTTTNTRNCGSICEKVTGSNVINVLKEGSGEGGGEGVPHRSQSFSVNHR